MKHRLFVTLLVVSVALTVQLQAHSQSSAETKQAPPTPDETTAAWTSSSSLKLTSLLGERLDYFVSWADYVVAARITFEAKTPKASEDAGRIQFQMDAQSVGVVRSLVMALDDQLISFFDPESTLPTKFEKHVQEGTRREDSTMIFDHKALIAHLGEEKIPIKPETRDVVSLYYYIRTLDLSSGKEYRLESIFHGKPFTVLITPEQKAVIETEVGNVEAIEIALRAEETVGRKKKINDDYHLRLWLTNDEKRTPVLITAHPSFGAVRVKLAKPE